MEFIHELVRTLQRPSVSQWDKDAFTVICKNTFYGFMEFVAMHYALSHRQDTPYWKSNFNKQWSEDIFISLHLHTMDLKVIFIIEDINIDLPIHKEVFTVLQQECTGVQPIFHH